MDELKKKEQKQISELLFKYFIMNDKYIAVQMPDGKYIPKKVFCSPQLVYDMLMCGASMGTYQQKYCTDIIKWICLDFDCDNAEYINELVERYVRPAACQLKELGIQFLAEYSGRRGIHLWIHFRGTITKALGYKIIDKISRGYRKRIREERYLALDLFPAVAGGSNKLGKQVKLPLSKHRKGKMSFFIPNIIEGDIREWLHLPERDDFWKIQRDILQGYKRNDPESIWSILEICPDETEIAKSLLYRKEFLLTDKKISLEEIQQKCGDCKIIRQIIDRAIEGNLRYLDRLVLAGCFGKMDRGNFLIDIMSSQSNYKADVTQKYLDAVKERYYPITLLYLYDLYDEQMEEELNPKETILSYIARKLGLSDSICSLEEIQQKDSEIRGRSFFEMIRDKEFQYMAYDNEVLTVNDYLKIKNLKWYDFQILESRLKIIMSAEWKEGRGPEKRYSVFKRWEEGKESPRCLVTLNITDRILTTALIFELVKETGWRFHSYSYNLNFFDYGSVFIPWFHAWKSFKQEVENYLYLDFFKEYGMIKLDLTNFYDSIYMHALYQQMNETLSEKTLEKEKVKRILDYLCWYTESLMSSIHGDIRGIPQGPAYARVLAELFLSTILAEFCKIYNYKDTNCRIIRYVDDIYVIYYGLDGKAFLQRFHNYVEKRGLQINRGKSAVYERIGNMKGWEKEAIFGDSEKNYALKSIQELELEDEDQQQEKIREFEKYLYRKGKWSISDANFILNRCLDPIFVEQYLNYYGEQLIQQKVGRGSIYSRLYHEIFEREKWMRKFFSKQLYRNIPLGTVNFGNFISMCYFGISKILLLQKEQQWEFVQWLMELQNLEIEEESTIRVIKKLIYSGKGQADENN